MTVVVELKTPYTPDMVPEKLKKESAGGFTVYTEPGEPAMYIADKQTLVFAFPKLLQAILERNGQPKLPIGLESAIKQAAAERSKTLYAVAIPPKNLPPIPDNPVMSTETLKDIDAVSFSANVAGDLSVNLEATCRDEKSAERFDKQLNGLVALAGRTAGIPEEAKKILGSVKITHSGVTASAQVSGVSDKVVAALLMPAVQAARETARRAVGANELKLLDLRQAGDAPVEDEAALLAAIIRDYATRLREARLREGTQIQRDEAVAAAVEELKARVRKCGTIAFTGTVADIIQEPPIWGGGTRDRWGISMDPPREFESLVHEGACTFGSKVWVKLDKEQALSIHKGDSITVRGPVSYVEGIVGPFGPGDHCVQIVVWPSDTDHPKMLGIGGIGQPHTIVVPVAGNVSCSTGAFKSLPVLRYLGPGQPPEKKIAFLPKPMTPMPPRQHNTPSYHGPAGLREGVNQLLQRLEENHELAGNFSDYRIRIPPGYTGHETEYEIGFLGPDGTLYVFRTADGGQTWAQLPPTKPVPQEIG